MRRCFCCIYKQGGDQGLEDCYDGGLPADLPQGRHPELTANGEGDEAQGHIVEQTQLFHSLKRIQTQAGNTQAAQAQGTDQKTRYQIAGNVGQIQLHRQTGDQQAHDHSRADGQ